MIRVRLLYAPEIKFFATQVETDSHLETPIIGLFVAGDGPGVAGNIVSAAATALRDALSILGVVVLRIQDNPQRRADAKRLIVIERIEDTL